MWFQCPYERGEGVWVQDNPGAPERNGCIVAEGFRETHGVTPRGETLRNQVHPRGGPSEDLHTGVITDKMGTRQAQVQIATL